MTDSPRAKGRARSIPVPADNLQRLLQEMQGLCALMPGRDSVPPPEQRSTGARHDA